MMHTMMPLNRIFVFFVIGLVLAPDKASAFSLQAQMLDGPESLKHFPKVMQFGMPHDSQFLFCHGEDCPARSIKHIALPFLPILTPPEWSSKRLLISSPAKVEPPELAKPLMEKQPK